MFKNTCFIQAFDDDKAYILNVPVLFFIWGKLCKRCNIGNYSLPSVCLKSLISNNSICHKSINQIKNKTTNISLFFLFVKRCLNNVFFCTIHFY